MQTLALAGKVILTWIIVSVNAKDMNHIWATENHHLRNYMIQINGNVGNLSVVTRGKCAYECCSHAACMSFFYNKKLSRCLLMYTAYLDQGMALAKELSLHWKSYTVYEGKFYSEKFFIANCDVLHLVNLGIKSK